MPATRKNRAANQKQQQRCQGVKVSTFLSRSVHTCSCSHSMSTNGLTMGTFMYCMERKDESSMVQKNTAMGNHLMAVAMLKGSYCTQPFIREDSTSITATKHCCCSTTNTRTHERDTTERDDRERRQRDEEQGAIERCLLLHFTPLTHCSCPSCSSPSCVLCQVGVGRLGGFVGVKTL